MYPAETLAMATVNSAYCIAHPSYANHYRLTIHSIIALNLQFVHSMKITLWDSMVSFKTISVFRFYCWKFTISIILPNLVNLGQSHSVMLFYLFYYFGRRTRCGKRGVTDTAEREWWTIECVMSSTFAELLNFNWILLKALEMTFCPRWGIIGVYAVSRDPK